jgi:hypothetical protein
VHCFAICLNRANFISDRHQRRAHRVSATSGRPALAMFSSLCIAGPAERRDWEQLADRGWASCYVKLPDGANRIGDPAAIVVQLNSHKNRARLKGREECRRLISFSASLWSFFWGC